MKLLFLCKKVPYPATDGESIVIMNDIEAMLSLGLEVHVLACNTSKHSIDTSTYSNLPFWTSFLSIDINTGLGLRHFWTAVVRDVPWHLARFYSKKFERTLSHIISKYDIDCVLYQGLAMTLYSTTIATQNLPKIYRIHNREQTIWQKLSQNSTSYFKKVVFSNIASSLGQYESYQLKNIIGMLCLSDDETAFFSHRYPSTNVATISIGIHENPEGSHYQVQENRKKILLVGSLDWLPNREGIEWFLEEVFPLLNSCQLNIAGKGKEDPKWHRNGVTIQPNFESIEALFASHDLLVVPLFSGAGIRIKLLEAMAYGMPTIATSIAAEGIVHRESIGVFDSPISMALEIEKWLENTAIRKEISTKLRADFNAFYSKNKIRDQWLHFFNSEAFFRK